MRVCNDTYEEDMVDEKIAVDELSGGAPLHSRRFSGLWKNSVCEGGRPAYLHGYSEKFIVVLEINDQGGGGKSPIYKQ